MPTYAPPAYPFPWPKDLVCGQPYINWPSNKPIFTSSDLRTEVAIPESWVNVGSDGKSNKTKEAYSLVLTSTTGIHKDVTRFIPMYRNKHFETSDDDFFSPDSYYLEYLGAPSLSTNLPCDTPYHMLQHQLDASPMAHYKLAHSDGNNLLFHLYSGDTENEYVTPTRDPLAKSGLVQACDKWGKNVEYEHGQPARCTFKETTALPSATGTSLPVTNNPGPGVNLGLAIGLPVGFLVVFVLIAVWMAKYGKEFLEKTKQRGRGGSIRL